MFVASRARRLKSGALGATICSSSVLGELSGTVGLTRTFLGTGSGAVGGSSLSDEPGFLFLFFPCGSGPRVKICIDGSPGKHPGMQLSLTLRAELETLPILDDRSYGSIPKGDVGGQYRRLMLMFVVTFKVNFSCRPEQTVLLNCM